MERINGRAAEAALTAPAAGDVTPNTIRSQDSKPPDVYRAICEVATGISRDGVSKGRRNEQQGYAFRGVDDVMNALSCLLANADLVILPKMSERKQEERITANGKPLFYVTVRADFDFVSARDGSKHVVTMYGEGMDSADKATNKAMSAAYKYACLQVFCIPTESLGPDADATTPEPKAKAPRPAETSTPKPPSPAQAIAERKIAAGNPATSKPWTNRGEMKRAFGQLREPVGESAYLNLLAEYQMTPLLNWKPGTENQAIECYYRLELLAQKAVA